MSRVVMSKSSSRFKRRHLRQSDNTLCRGPLWEISERDILKQYRKVGSGSYGIVYESELRNHGRVAVKVLHLSLKEEGGSELFKSEILAKCRHPNIISFLGYVRKPIFSIVTEWCSGASLFEHVHIRNTKLNNAVVVHMCIQMCQAMSYMHARDMIHCDLKSNNVFLQPNGERWFVKIGDMGLTKMSKAFNNGAMTNRNPTGSILWMAPEIIRMDVSNPYSVFSDSYAFGVILYEIGSQKLPYEETEYNRDQILFLVGIGRLSLNVDLLRNDFPIELSQIILHCCQFKREKRCTFDDMLDILNNLWVGVPKISRSQSLPDDIFLEKH